MQDLTPKFEVPEFPKLFSFNPEVILLLRLWQAGPFGPFNSGSFAYGEESG